MAVRRVFVSMDFNDEGKYDKHDLATWIECQLGSETDPTVWDNLNDMVRDIKSGEAT